MNPMLIPMWFVTVAVGTVGTVLTMFVPPQETREGEGATILPLKLKAQPT